MLKNVQYMCYSKGSLSGNNKQYYLNNTLYLCVLSQSQCGILNIIIIYIKKEIKLIDTPGLMRFQLLNTDPSSSTGI